MRKRQLGLTLLELVVAFLLLAIGVIAILELIGQSVLNARYARDRTVATMLAQKKIEELLADPELSAGEIEGDFGDSYPQFRWRALIREWTPPQLRVETNPRPLWHITVTVEWPDRGQIQGVTLETLQSPIPLLSPGEEETISSPRQGSNLPSRPGIGEGVP